MNFKKRFAIYCFYDSKGIVGEYVFYYLDALKKVANYVYVVANCKIEEKSLKRLQLLVDRVDQRDNCGFDAYAYRHALEQCKEQLCNYDELIFSNNSFYGPFYPLEEVFEKMTAKGKNVSDKSDFWGITIHPKQNAKINEKQHYDYINEHIQSYFVVFSKKVFTSDIFVDFFKNLPQIDSFLDAVVLFELELTRILSEQGNFKYSSLVDCSKFPGGNSTIQYAYELYREEKCPFIKRKVFYEKYHEFISARRGDQSCRIMDDLKQSKNYPIAFIWSDLLRTQPMSVLRHNMHLNTVLSEKEALPLSSTEKEKKIALILYIYYEDLVENCLSYALNLKEIADVYVVCSKDETLTRAKDVFNRYDFKKLNFIKKINKGRDLSSYLIDAQFVFEKYDYVCYFHDKKSPQLGDSYVVKDFFAHCIDSILPSQAFALNVIKEFENNASLGLLVPAPLNWGPFYPSEYNLHPENRKLMIDIIKTLNLNVPFDEYPVAPYGDYFWVRSDAIKPLFNKKWTYDDLPPEPLAIDGTILHALERIIPFCVQSAGFYTSWLNSSKTEKIYVDNCYYYTRMFNEHMFKIFPFCNLVNMRGFLELMVHNLSFSDNKLNTNSTDKVSDNDLIRQFVKLQRKYHKYVVINLLTLNLVAKFRKKRLKLKENLENLFK